MAEGFLGSGQHPGTWQSDPVQALEELRRVSSTLRAARRGETSLSHATLAAMGKRLDKAIVVLGERLLEEQPGNG